MFSVRFHMPLERLLLHCPCLLQHGLALLLLLARMGWGVGRQAAGWLSCALVSGFPLCNPIAIYTTAGQTKRDADAGMESLVLWRVQPARCSFLPSKLISSQR